MKGNYNMKILAKIYEKKMLDNQGKIMYSFYNLITLNKDNTRVIYGNIKWYIKKEEVLSKLSKGNNIFEVNVIRISDKTTSKGNKVNVFEINSLETTLKAKDYENVLNNILEKTNIEKIQKVLE